jgi:hypothetical protein
MIAISKGSLFTHVLPKVHLTPLVYIYPHILATECITVVLYVFTCPQHHTALLHSMFHVAYVATKFAYTILDDHTVG